MSESEIQLLELLKRRSFRRGEFRLASGDESNYYIDGKMTEVFSEGAYLIGEVIYEQTKGLNIDAIGGLETGAIPLTTAAVLSYHLHGKPMEGFWVRDKIKDHGTQKVIEGNLKQGARVVIIEDVVTKGSSAIKAIEAVRKAGCEVMLVLALVDRKRGADALFRSHDINCYQAIFSIQDFGVEE
ncbi:MAG TPA: orotate phosphoribosyltransferase [Gemmataceae bacterium]|jgi:orotate phosphoribosyltransferase|nr:orotate phosphoribosyltransferase [Gemmataceae bacterium]